MGYLVRAYYSISPTRYYKDDSCWSVDLKSKATEDIISIGSFLEALVLNHYVLVRKIFCSGVYVDIAYWVPYGGKHGCEEDIEFCDDGVDMFDELDCCDIED
ncbi:hypothetical protein Tco_0824449, partial [Tanacetum coccineum]